MSEVEKAINQLKSHKAAGLTVMIRDIQQLSKKWNEGSICAIYEKNHKLDDESYRAINILNGN